MRRRPTDAVVLALLAAADLALHVAVSGRYGYWIDELYFVVCGQRLAWGYVDHPPLVAAAARAGALLGDGLPALRLLPALAGAGLVFATGWLARSLGGGRAAQVLAATAVLASPVHQLFSSVLTMNSFEPIFWLGCLWLVIRMARGGSPALWLVVGAVAGVGLLNKHSLAFLLAALVGALLLTPQRALLRGPWPWLGAAVALAIVSPHLLWQADRGWPTLELLANARRYQHQPVTPLEFAFGQFQLVNPLALPVWSAGLAFLLFARGAAGLRFVGWSFVLLFAAFVWLQAKTYYLGPFYPVLFAAGGVAWEEVGRRARRGWIPWGVTGLAAAGGVAILPYVVPLLPVELIPAYTRMLAMREVRAETRPMGDVPQIFADMLAWDELVAAVARVYGALPADERASAVLWGNDYGDAAAIDVLGRDLGLPTAVSGHQNYYLWGPRAAPDSTWVAVGFGERELVPWFAEVELAAEVECEHCMPDRRRQAIYVCRGLRVRPEEFWPMVKCWTCDRPPFAGAPVDGGAQP